MLHGPSCLLNYNYENERVRNIITFLSTPEANKIGCFG